MAFTATTPPKRFVSAETSSNIFGSDRPKTRGASQVEQRRESAREIDDDEHKDRALEDVAVLLQRLEDRGQRRQQDRAEDRPDDIRDAAGDGEDEDLHRAREAELIRLDREVEVCRETAGPAGDERAKDERGE